MPKQTLQLTKGTGPYLQLNFLFCVFVQDGVHLESVLESARHVEGSFARLDGALDTRTLALSANGADQRPPTHLQTGKLFSCSENAQNSTCTRMFDRGRFWTHRDVRDLVDWFHFLGTPDADFGYPQSTGHVSPLRSTPERISRLKISTETGRRT